MKLSTSLRRLMKDYLQTLDDTNESTEPTVIFQEYCLQEFLNWIIEKELATKIRARVKK